LKGCFNFCTASMQPEEEREGKKEKQIDVKPNWTTMHALSKEKKDIKTNQMIRWKHD
jgi:hypothetical protein